MLSEMASTKKKRSYEWKDLYADEYGLKVVAQNAMTSRVETVSCRFCIAFGREESIDACNAQQRRRIRTTMISDRLLTPTMLTRSMKWLMVAAIRGSGESALPTTSTG